MGPLMLVMGIHPRVSSATTATMIVMTSNSVAILFVTAGLVPWQYVVCFFCVCFCGAVIGKTYIDAYVKRTGNASLLIFLLATIICLATLGCVVIVFTRLAASNWCLSGFHKFCNLSDEDDDEEYIPDEEEEDEEEDYLPDDEDDGKDNIPDGQEDDDNEDCAYGQDDDHDGHDDDNDGDNQEMTVIPAAMMKLKDTLGVLPTELPSRTWL